jgi:hypothetical protein
MQSYPVVPVIDERRDVNPEVLKISISFASMSFVFSVRKKLAQLALSSL